MISFLNLNACSRFSVAALVAFAASATATIPVESQIERFQGSDFSPLLSQWEAMAPTPFPSLLSIAKNPKKEETHRYIAIMGAARVAGAEVIPLLLPLLKDKSWFVRSAMIKVISQLGDAATSRDVLPLLTDPALVVRNEAIVCVRKHKPLGSEQAFLRVLKDKRNFHRGKALWAPILALEALREFGPAIKTQAPEILSLYQYRSDLALLKAAHETLVKLTGHTIQAKNPTLDKSAWEKYFKI